MISTIFKLEPSLTLGCGSWGVSNSVSENVGVKHLLNIKTVAEREENMLWFRVPEKIYFKYGSLPMALKELEREEKGLFIITDAPYINWALQTRLQRNWTLLILITRSLRK